MRWSWHDQACLDQECRSLWNPRHAFGCLARSEAQRARVRKFAQGRSIVRCWPQGHVRRLDRSLRLRLFRIRCLDLRICSKCRRIDLVLGAPQAVSPQPRAWRRLKKRNAQPADPFSKHCDIDYGRQFPLGICRYILRDGRWKRWLIIVWRIPRWVQVLSDRRTEVPLNIPRGMASPRNQSLCPPHW